MKTILAVLVAATAIGAATTLPAMAQPYGYGYGYHHFHRHYGYGPGPRFGYGHRRWFCAHHPRACY